ncbi:hypothetical protein ADIWIN_2287 [Winogradskyella psychrotolerans RS-3]|uniref:Secretion system C-terminal sorting domain-containing protein n=1 Tax=Winogradskyella psychrotolerans RS-3 TaxID=641526 RepID=S7X0Z5_9FLAO|nr:T9SS type A sorting domain-containing protein [Winogradskyella psychrotolerans]EPR72674.1 hypothetical protein ADIWIN_2287 [Winogradskyella psychrotolerans RS-3]
MKKITLLLFALFTFIFSNQISAQCTVDSAAGPYTDFNGTFGGAPCDDGTGSPFNELTFSAWADEAYLMDNIISGYTYTFSLCNGDGAGTWVPSYTIIAPSGATDAVGLDAGSTCAITWTATEAGTYTIVISEEGVACGTSTNSAVNNGFPAITGTDGENCPVCNETTIPSSTATAPYPADGETAVAISSPDGGLSFEWTAPAIDGETYNLNIGGTNPPTQTLEGINSGDLITGLAVSTTYYWSIDVVNCFGATTTTTVWSFTTDDTLLSIDENALTTFSVYPNPTANILNIKSSQEIDNVTVFNLLGQNVASFSKNEITNSSIDMSELSNGLYLVKITSGDKTQTLRVTKE